MYKLIILAIFVALASARIGHWSIPAKYGNATGPLGLVLEGYNDFFKIENDADLDKCANVPLLQDINKTLIDLNATHPNPIALVADVVSLYSDYNKIKASCPQVAAGYQVFFSNFTTAAKKDPKGTLQQVVDNVTGNEDNFRKWIAQFGDDYKANQFYQAGQDLGQVTKIALAGYVPQ